MKLELVDVETGEMIESVDLELLGFLRSLRSYELGRLKRRPWDQRCYRERSFLKWLSPKE